MGTLFTTMGHYIVAIAGGMQKLNNLSKLSSQFSRR